MAHTLSTDLRKRLIAAVESGQSRRAAARGFGVAPSTAIRWVNAWKRDGSYEARPRGGNRRALPLDVYASEILSLIDKQPDITLSEITDHLVEVHGVRVVPSTVWRLLDRHGISFKKNRTRCRTTAL